MNKAVVEEGVGQAIVENESGNELNRYIGRNMTVNCSISKEYEKKPGSYERTAGRNQSRGEDSFRGRNLRQDRKN